MAGENRPLNIVTGGFGFSGKYIVRRLLACDERVRTLTNHPASSSPFAMAPLDFRNPQQLVDNMAGASVLYNTYWVRFARGAVSHEKAVENTSVLLRAAQQAGISRVVHISITNPSLDSPLSYFRGKALVEELIKSSALSYAILRPAVVFGREDILINNIAWLLRRFPIFAIPGGGEYGLQPIFVEDLAALAVDSGHRGENLILDAVGPEIYQYQELVQVIRDAINSRSRIVHAPPLAVRLASFLLGSLLNDVILTKQEISGLMANLLVSKQAPTGRTSLRDWLWKHAQEIGSEYASEVARHYAAPRTTQLMAD